MRKSAWSLLLLVCLPCCLNAQKVRYGQGLPKAKPGVSYPLKVQVSAMRLRTECQGGDLCEQLVYVDAVLNGQKVELSGYAWVAEQASNPPLLPGDYLARFLKGPHSANGAPLFQKYEVLLPDGTIWDCRVTGLAE
jgi:hypothetical protein